MTDCMRLFVVQSTQSLPLPSHFCGCTNIKRMLLLNIVMICNSEGAFSTFTSWTWRRVRSQQVNAENGTLSQVFSWRTHIARTQLLLRAIWVLSRKAWAKNPLPSPFNLCLCKVLLLQLPLLLPWTCLRVKTPSTKKDHSNLLQIHVVQHSRHL